MNRTPPISIRRLLRKEVGFGCPVPDCGNPYLYWHHFDPPWSEKKHHNPSGMIALCAEHHAKADAGAFTKNQLHEFKHLHQKEKISGKFDWMRDKILSVVGGNFYYDTPIILAFGNKPAIWFNRDDDGYLLLNIRMITLSGEPRVHIEDNFWLNVGTPEDLECPPSGKLLKAIYSGGDYLKIEFFEFESSSSVKDRYPEKEPEEWDMAYPLAVVEVCASVGGTAISLNTKETILPGGIIIKNYFSKRNRVGLNIF